MGRFHTIGLSKGHANFTQMNVLNIAALLFTCLAIQTLHIWSL